MATRNSKVILAKNIRLDRDYQNTTDYSEANLLLALQSQTHFVASKTECSFIREENAIYLEIPYGTALTANYLAFQNPDYSNKWFFAFIDSVEYIGEKILKLILLLIIYLLGMIIGHQKHVLLLVNMLILMLQVIISFQNHLRWVNML